MVQFNSSVTVWETDNTLSFTDLRPERELAFEQTNSSEDNSSLDLEDDGDLFQEIQPMDASYASQLDMNFNKSGVFEDVEVDDSCSSYQFEGNLAQENPDVREESLTFGDIFQGSGSNLNGPPGLAPSDTSSNISAKNESTASLIKNGLLGASQSFLVGPILRFFGKLLRNQDDDETPNIENATRISDAVNGSQVGSEQLLMSTSFQESSRNVATSFYVQ